MKNAFPGFPPEGLAFLRDLVENNDREWFIPRKSIYEDAVRRPMIDLVTAVQNEMLGFAPDYTGEPAKTVYRIYRDTRFSKNKTPYKTHIAANLPRHGLDKDGGAGFYFAISAKEVAIGGGLYAPLPETLLAIRTRIAEDPAAFEKTFQNARIKKLLGELKGEKLTRVPKGFAPDHPAAELLKHKQFMLYTTLPADLAASPKLLREIVSRIEAMTLFAEYLNQPLLEEKTRQQRNQNFLL